MHCGSPDGERAALLARFERDARAIGKHDGTDYPVIEYVEDEALRDR